MPSYQRLCFTKSGDIVILGGFLAVFCFFLGTDQMMTQKLGDF